MPKEKNAPVWGKLDKDQLDYESNFNPENTFQDGPRMVDNDNVLTTGLSANRAPE
jgi:hypothetical protein